VLFHSYEFLLVFLPAVLLVYYALPGAARALWLTAVSYVFYGWAKPDSIALLALLTVVNYVGGLGVSRAERRGVRRLWLAFSVGASLGVLGYYKYADFLIRSWNDVSGGDVSPLGVVLPVGISFYTFQSMSYPIDIYRGAGRPTRRLIDFACYVSLFPQLIAGPIVRYHEVADQLESRTHNVDKAARGLVFFVTGLAKKLLLADSVAVAAEALFDHGAVGLAPAWLGLLAYAFQIYFDFSGYSDMAIGLGLLLGFEFPRNFDSPYQAVGIRDFWRRWHMSLSRWLRDYLYIPLGGSRRGTVRTYVNVLLTMLLGGLWHGANWTFVLWGGFHGMCIAVERALDGRNPLTRLPRRAKVAGTFFLVTLAWVLFRSDSMAAAGDVFGSLFGANGFGALPAAMSDGWVLGALAVCAGVAWGGRNAWHWRMHITERTALWVVPLFLLCLVRVVGGDYSPFLYFQF